MAGGGGGVGCRVVVGVADAVCGGRLGVAGVVGLGVGGGALEGLLSVIRGGGSRSRDILRAGDWAWGGLDECALSRMSVRGTLRGGEEWDSGGGLGLVSSEAGLEFWDIVRVRGGLPLVECVRALARLGVSDVCGGFRRGRRAMQVLWEAGAEG